MTDARQILLALGEALHDNQISEDMCYGAVKALRSVPPEHHMAALKSLLGLEDQEPEEQPEDYLAVKTFVSDTFHVGDEVIGVIINKKGVITNIRDKYIDVTWKDGSSGAISISVLKRTGRNFPAIPAILEELKKGVDKSGRE